MDKNTGRCYVWGSQPLLLGVALLVSLTSLHCEMHIHVDVQMCMYMELFPNIFMYRQLMVLLVATVCQLRHWTFW